MMLFCLLWMPVFLCFWLTIRPENSNSRMFWALILGAIAAIARFFTPALIDAGGFGLSRYFSAYVDYTSLPVMIPLIFVSLVSRLFPKTGITDFTGFTLMAMIPVALVSSIPWGVRRDFLRLVLTPLFWTAFATASYPLSVISGRVTTGGGPSDRKLYRTAALGILAFSLLPPLAWWSFFCNKNIIGTLLLLLTVAPALTVCTLLFMKKQLFMGERP
jgi:hypothetical protein